MSTNKRIDYSNHSDMALLELFKQEGDRDAVRELYQRYCEPVGRFLYRGVKDRIAVANAFNEVMLRLISDTRWLSAKASLSTRIFSLAYQLRHEYREGSRSERFDSNSSPSPSMVEDDKGAQLITTLPKQHQAVLELVYQHDFSFEQTATILGCTMAAVRNCWSEAKSTQFFRHTGGFQPSILAQSCRQA